MADSWPAGSSARVWLSRWPTHSTRGTSSACWRTRWQPTPTLPPSRGTASQNSLLMAMPAMAWLAFWRLASFSARGWMRQMQHRQLSSQAPSRCAPTVGVALANGDSSNVLYQTQLYRTSTHCLSMAGPTRHPRSWPAARGPARAQRDSCGGRQQGRGVILLIQLGIGRVTNYPLSCARALSGFRAYNPPYYMNRVQCLMDGCLKVFILMCDAPGNTHCHSLSLCVRGWHKY